MGGWGGGGVWQDGDSGGLEASGTVESEVVAAVLRKGKGAATHAM